MLGLYRNTPAGTRTAIDAEIRAQFEAARKQNQPEPLDKFLNCFIGFPIAGEARRELAGRPGPGLLDRDEVARHADRHKLTIVAVDEQQLKQLIRAA